MLLTRGWTLDLIRPRKCELRLVIFRESEYEISVGHVTYQFDYLVVESDLSLAFLAGILPALLCPPHLVHWTGVWCTRTEITSVKWNSLSENLLHGKLIIASLWFPTCCGTNLDRFMPLGVSCRVHLWLLVTAAGRGTVIFWVSAIFPFLELVFIDVRVQTIVDITIVIEIVDVIVVVIIVVNLAYSGNSMPMLLVPSMSSWLLSVSPEKSLPSSC